MLFNSIDFLFFFPIVVALLFVIPKQLRGIWLLIASYYFYMSWNPKYALLMAFSTFVTWLSGILMGRCEKDEVTKKKWIVAGSFLINLSILFVFKYANFIMDSVTGVLNQFGVTLTDKRLDLLLPVGISFYTFQALSYTMDVYRGTIKAEKNFLQYALFVSFFPQLVAGPIERSGNLLSQIQGIAGIKLWNFERVRDGLLLMFWGLFQKLVIADRTSILVNEVYNNYERYGLVEIAVATVLFAFQIYCDFGGYTNVARGAARVMGFELMQNFRQPYLACNIKDFWRRWHISLTTWFTDYLYIPLGGNRKGELRKNINVCIVYLVSGLWHGASWNYVAWGGLHAIYQVVGNLKAKVVKRPDKESRYKSLIQIIVTFVLVDIAWVFFAAPGFSHALRMFKQMSICVQTTSLLDLGLDKGNWFVLIVAILILYIIDILHECNRSVFAIVNSKPLVVRWILYLGLIWFIILFGIYGVGYDTGQFIYFQF